MKATIISKTKLRRSEKYSKGPIYDYFKMVLGVADSYLEAKPGQFIMLCGDWGLDTKEGNYTQHPRTDPLLRRPFSIYRKDKIEKQIQIVYRVMGKGTKRISEMDEGDKVDIIGPFGNPFPQPIGKQRVILAAGSIGVPPLIALAETMKDKPLLILGGRTENDVVFLKDDITELNLDTIYVSEDDTCQIKAKVTDILEESVKKGDRVYACGPNRMLAEIARLADKVGFEAYVSFEERMACGIGVCLGCAVRHRNGSYVHVCKDGPVFNVRDIDWDRV